MVVDGVYEMKRSKILCLFGFGLLTAILLVSCTLAGTEVTVEPTEMNIPVETTEAAGMATPVNTAEPPESEFTGTLEVLEVSPDGEVVNLGFTLTNNTDTSLYVLKWYTPLEGIYGAIFHVSRDGRSIPYLGIAASRAEPIPENYVFLEPGESVASEVDLASSYDFSQSGTYRIAFISPRISHIARTEAEMAKDVDELHPVDMPTNPVTVRIGESNLESDSQILPTATPRPVLLREAADLIQSYLQIEQPLSLEELATDEIKHNLRVQVFRILEGPYANESFLIRNQTVVPMGAAYGGQGLTSLEISDLDGDGEAELLFTYSFGSGLHQSRISMYAPAYDQYRVYDADFGYLGDIGVVKLESDDIGVRVVEADPSTLTIRFLDTLGYLGIEEKNDQPELVVEILPNLPDEVRQNIFSPQTSEPLEPDGVSLGLVYTTGAGEGLWIIEQDGQHRMLTEHLRARLSPDHQKLLFSFEGDIYLEDLMDGETRNLTNTPDKIERGYQWWPANTQMIVFNFKYHGEEGPSEGYLGAVDTAGMDYQILDDSAVSFSSPALSPDGTTIAYNPLGVPTLYHLEKGFETIQTTEYDLDIRIAASPAWSPEGRFLAWKVFGDEPDGSGWSAVMVLDLMEAQANLLHRYRVLGGTNVMPGLSWSPDGRWLAMLTQGEFPLKTPSLWVLSADGREEHYLGSGISPVWSPEGRWLAYTSWPAGGGSYEELSAFILDIESWEPQLAGLPQGAVVVDWLSQAS